MSDTDRDRLMAYLDDALPAADRADFEARLAGDEAGLAELAALRRQGDAISALYRPVEAEAVPARLDPHRLALGQARRCRRHLAIAASIAAALVLGLAAGMTLRPAPAAPALYDRLIADAVSAHTVYAAESRHAVEVAGSEGAHLSAWLSDRLGMDLVPPDLSEAALSFLGGRLLPAPGLAGGRAAQLMYENAEGERITLYITPARGVDGPELETVRFGPDSALYWADERVTCTIVGAVPPEALQALAGTVFGQLRPREGRNYRAL